MSPLEPFRWIVGQGVLLYEKLTRGQPLQRTSAAQAAVDAKLKGLAIYEFRSCPFCMKVRKYLHRQNLQVELRDARRNAEWGDELRNQGGKFQVPCLRIANPDGTYTWLYESSDILRWFQERVPD